MTKGVCASLAAGVLLAGCGGGGGSSTPSAPIAVAATASPTPAPGATTAPTQTARLTLTFSVGVRSGASRKRAPKYISPNTGKFFTEVISVNGAGVNIPDTTTTLTFNGGTSSGDCTVVNQIASCIVDIPAPVGAVKYSFIAESSIGQFLSSLTTTITIVQGVVNTPSVTLQGLVDDVTVTGAALNANDAEYAANGELLTVTAFDGSGATINGSADYAQAFQINDNDTTGQTKLTINGGAPASTVTSTNPSDVVRLFYTGQAVNTVNIFPTGGTLDVNSTTGGNIAANVDDITFTGTTDDTDANGGLPTDPNYGQQTVFFSSLANGGTISAAELGYSNVPFDRPFTIDLGPVSDPNSCASANIVDFQASGPTGFNIAPTGPGVCYARIEETGTGYPLTDHTANVAGSETHDGTFWVSITTSTFGVNARHRRT